MKRYFTSESVTEGHPDKICDQIADAILDELIKNDPLSRVAVEALDGRIVRTAGFAHNLEGYARGRDSLGEGGVRSLRWQADFPDLKLYSVSIACRDRPAGDETIIILGKDIHTRRIDESCSTEGSGLDWSFKNRYWLDPSSGLVWRSIQHVHPRLDAIETETLRPPF
jgi:hypothetical protein